jgi:hypothetical protein
MEKKTFDFETFKGDSDGKRVLDPGIVLENDRWGT